MLKDMGFKSLFGLLAIGASLLFATAAHAQDDALPDSVVQPYLEYESAMAARDYMAARDAALAAYDAAQAEGSDAATTAQLAENYAQLAAATGEAGAAFEAWRHAARLSDSVDLPETERVWRWYGAALAAYADGDAGEARACARRAAGIARSHGDAVQDEVEGRAHFLHARLLAERGRLRTVGASARRAIAAFEAAEENPDPGMLASSHYLAGVDSFMRYRYPDAARHFFLARGYFGPLGDSHARDRNSSGFFLRLARDRFDADEEAEFNAFARDSIFPALAVEWREEAEETRWDTDASPVGRRAQPDYRQDALMADVEGIVLVGFEVGADGRTSDIEILASAPPGIFDADVIEAVERWRYEPAQRDGEPVARPGVVTEFIFTICDWGDRSCGDDEEEEAD